MNKRELLISRMRGLEEEYAKHEAELFNYPQLANLIVPKLDYIAKQYEKWEEALTNEVDNGD